MDGGNNNNPALQRRERRWNGGRPSYRLSEESQETAFPGAVNPFHSGKRQAGRQALSLSGMEEGTIVIVHPDNSNRPAFPHFPSASVRRRGATSRSFSRFVSEASCLLCSVGRTVLMTASHNRLER